MRYLAALDYEHLDNSLFLTTLARSISRQNDVQLLIIHGESAYTERIIQTGVMREEATLRSIKDLNHRLIALLADEGVSTTGINGYQRQFIIKDGNVLTLNHAYLQSLPAVPVLLVSTLVYDVNSQQAVPIPLAGLCVFLSRELDAGSPFIFSAADNDELPAKGNIKKNKQDEDFTRHYIPSEFQQFPLPFRLTTARNFHRLPELEDTLLIE